MSHLSPRSLLTWVITSLVAMLAWFLLPGTTLDQWAFRTLAVEGTVEGEGSHAKPWRLLYNNVHTETAPSPASIGLKDNLEDIFQSSPHSPIDMAVIFNNLRRLGTQKLACSVLLSWDDPDPIGLAAMESALSEFDVVILSAPVTRGAITETMPPDMMRASLSVDAIKGDPSAIPTVNRVSIPDLIRGGDNSLTGFGVIDSEPTEDALHLIARWDDRVIFAFPVITAAQHLEVSLEELEIEVGSHLQFGAEGPRIAIDEFGRLAIDFDQATSTDLVAEDLIDAETGDAELPSLTNSLLSDLRSHADITTRDFNRVLMPSMAVMMSGEGKAETKVFARLSSHWEVIILLVIALSWSVGRNRNWIILLAQLTLFPLAVWYGMLNGLWFPALAVIITVIIGWLCTLTLSGNRKRTTSMPRLDRLAFEAAATPSAETEPAPDKPEEEQDYALAPKDTTLDSKHESD